MAKHNEIGRIGERVTKTFLMKHGYSVLAENYRAKAGEIDIVAMKNDILHIIEVKSVSVNNLEDIDRVKIHPEDHFTQEKWRRVVRGGESYCLHYHIQEHIKRYIDLATVYIDEKTRKAQVTLLFNVTYEE